MDRPSADPGRAQAAVALVARHERALRRTAWRWSLCRDDADDAYQGAVEILLTRSPPGIGLDRLAAWMNVVIRHEALAIRIRRERLLAHGVRDRPSGDAAEPLERAPSPRPGPAERAERRERFEVAARLLGELKPDERLAIVLQACGYSYAEIAAACEWTYTKVNRCLAEGRERLRELDRAEAEASG